MTTTQTLAGLTVRKAVERAKAEITADIVKGRVPASVADFATLHDFVDANEYGGLTDEAWYDAALAEAAPGDPDPGVPQALADFANAVQDAVDAWLREGRPTMAIPESRPTLRRFETPRGGRSLVGIEGIDRDAVGRVHAVWGNGEEVQLLVTWPRPDGSTVTEWADAGTITPLGWPTGKES